MAYVKNATYKELFDALQAIVSSTQCMDVMNPTHGQVPIAHLARAARIVEAAKGAVADKRIITKCVEIESKPEVKLIPRASGKRGVPRQPHTMSAAEMLAALGPVPRKKPRQTEAD